MVTKADVETRLSHVTFVTKFHVTSSNTSLNNCNITKLVCKMSSLHVRFTVLFSVMLCTQSITNMNHLRHVNSIQFSPGIF